MKNNQTLEDKTKFKEEDQYAVLILYSKCFGLRSFEKIYQHFGSCKKIWHAKPDKLHNIIGRSKTLEFLDFKQSNKTDSIIPELFNNSIQIINPRSIQWEYFFAFISDKPICLFAKGDINLLRNKKLISVSVVGTRKPTAYGKSQTKQIASNLAKNAITIISGMAYGIDSIAHKATLDANGKTIAILGTPIDRPYPSSNRQLYSDILKSGGLILSEFPPGASVHPSNFVRRNRLISGLSNAVLIIEGAKRSGTLLTGKYANEQGIDTFALPGPITSPYSYSPHHHIKQGAKLITSAADILEEFDIRSSDTHQAETQLSHLSKEYKKIFDLLKKPQTANEIINTTQLSLVSLLPILTELEVLRLIKLGIDGKYYATIDI